MAEENVIQEFRFKNTDETRNYFVEQIEQNELMSSNLKDKSIIKKKKKQVKIILLAKTKFNSTEILISMALTYSYISHNEFVSANYVLREYDNLKEEIKNLKTSAIYKIF